MKRKKLLIGLFVALFVLIIGGLSQLFIPSNSIEQLIFAICGALIFCLFVLYDTSRLIYSYSEDEYILAAIELYLDIVNLFLYLLRFFGLVSRNN